MYCEKCGMENKEDAKFCEGCGSKMAQSEEAASPVIPQPPEDTSVFNETELLPSALKGIKTKIKKPALSKKHKLLIAVAAALIIVVVGLISTVSAISKPERLVEKYFESTMAGEWEKVYEYLDIEDSGFTSKSSFLALKEEGGKTDLPEITNFSVKENKSSGLYSYSNNYSSDADEDKALTKSYTVTYTIKGISSPMPINVSLVKQKGKQFLFFDKYKVASDNFVIPEVTIEVLEGAALYLDGTQVGGEFLLDKTKLDETDYYSDSDMDIYKINGVLVGKHKVKVTTPVTADYEKDVTLSPSNPLLTVSDAVVSSTQAESLHQQAAELLRGLYDSAIARKSFDEFIQGRPVNEQNLDKIRSQYEDFYNEICPNDSSRGITEISFSNLSFDNAETKVREKIVLEVRMNFQYNFVAYRNILYNEMYSNEYPYNGSAKISYIYSGGEWKINSLNNIAVDY